MFCATRLGAKFLPAALQRAIESFSSYKVNGEHHDQYGALLEDLTNNGDECLEVLSSYDNCRLTAVTSGHEQGSTHGEAKFADP